MKLLDKKFKKIISKQKISKKIQSVANRINKDYKNKNPIFLCVLDGSFMFAAEIYKKIKIKSDICFIKINSYKGTKSKKIKNILGVPKNTKNRDVVIVEDIVDTGKTIKYIIKNLEYKSIKVLTLLSKPKVHNMNLDYVGFEIPNKFVIGYGLDYNGQGRNLLEIYDEA